jgi:23S rRNA pseudouridine1911/1915/1917 synthase
MQITNLKLTSVRADTLLSKAYPQYSRSALSKLFDMGNISLDNTAIKAGTKIKPNHTIIVDISPLTKPADDIDLPIIYEDDNVIVIDKPSGVISHARGRYWDESSVASFVRQKVVDLSGERAGIVHRLDRATSGVMICAKNADTLSFLQKQFSTRKVNKHYQAIVRGNVNPNKGIIDIPLGRSPKYPNKFIVTQVGKPSQTEYNSTILNNSYSLVDLHPLTGRTHQLRLHLKHLGYPIVGDELYGGEPASRLMLHAISLEITIPGGVRKIFTSPLPKGFQEFSK